MGCGKSPFQKAYEIPVAPGKTLQVYYSGKTVFFEWQGERIGFEPPEGDRVIGISADEQDRLFLFTQKIGYASIKAGRMQDGKIYKIDLVDMPRDLFTINLRYRTPNTGKFNFGDADFLFGAVYNSNNYMGFSSSELWAARFPSPKIDEKGNSLLDASYREVALPWPDWIDSVTPESFAVWGDDQPTQESQLFWLTTTELVGQAKKLLDAKVNVDCRSPGGRTPLMHAALHGNLEMMNLLLDYGADLEAENFNGETVLFYSVYSHNEKITSFLNSEMSDLYHRNRFQENVLMCAIMSDPEIAGSIFICEEGWGYGSRDKPLRRVKLNEIGRYLELSDRKPWQEMDLVKHTNLANETILHYLGRKFGTRPGLYGLLEDVLKCRPFPRPRCNFEQKDFAGKTALYYFIDYYSPGYYAYEGYHFKAIKMLKEVGVDFKSSSKELLELVNPPDDYEKPLYEFLLKAMEEE